MQIQRFVVLFAAVALAVGCDDGGGGDVDAARFDAAVVDGGGGNGGDGGSGGTGETVEHLRLSYIKEVTPRDGSPPSIDMVIFDFDDNEEFNLTRGLGDVDCVTKKCRLNPDMTWIGWLETDPGGGGFRLFVAPVDVKRKEVGRAEKRLVDDGVNDFEFTTYKEDPFDDASPEVELVIYSKGQAAGPTAKIDVRASPVAAPDEATCADGGGLPDCPGLVGLINTNGAFRVTDFGSLIILIETTLSTMTLNFFNIASGAQQTIYTFGDEGMTGSEFSGRQPIGFSPDATYLAVFTRTDFVWRLNALEARPSPPAPAVKELFEVSTHPEGDCIRAMPYNFNEVRFDPRFSADGGLIYFLARGDCSRQPGQENPTNRDDFDILRINRNLTGEVENVTHNLRASHWSNHDIGDFDLSPDGHRLAFTAQRPNQATNRSIWVIDPDTGEYDCSRGPVLVDLGDGPERCEFIFDDRNGADVKHRDLNFHIVAVPVD